MKLAVIGGSGLDEFTGLETGQSHRMMTAWGRPSDAVTSGMLNGVELLFLPRHGAGHQLPPHRINYRANIGVLADLGAEAIVATAAVGGITTEAVPGIVVIPDQLIDYTSDREHTFFDGSQPRPPFLLLRYGRGGVALRDYFGTFVPLYAALFPKLPISAAAIRPATPYFLRCKA